MILGLVISVFVTALVTWLFVKYGFQSGNEAKKKGELLHLFVVYIFSSFKIIGVLFLTILRGIFHMDSAIVFRWCLLLVALGSSLLACAK
jgi:hypothetical protein